MHVMTSCINIRMFYAHDALEDPTALPQRPHSVVKQAVHTPSRGVVIVHVQNDRRRMAFKAMAQRSHSAHTVRTSANALDVVETL